MRRRRQDRENRQRQADLRFLAGFFLKLTAHHQIKQLLAAAEFHVRADLDAVLPLH